jgi:2'-5' RNA ligase
VLRSFVALDLPEAVLDRVILLQERIGFGRTVAEDNLHLTLAFLGDQPEPVLEELHHALETLKPPPVTVALSGLDTFGGRAPKLVAASALRDPGLVALRRSVRTAAESVGIALPRERFRPHVTLARFGSGLRAEDAGKLARFLQGNGDFSAGPDPAPSFTLYRSILKRDGADYDALADYPLPQTIP